VTVTCVNDRDHRVVGPAWQAPTPAAPAPTVTLHPNLARIAVDYQRVCERLARGELDVTVANTEIRALIARDDEGVAWTINPRDGGWLYWARRGEWVSAEPPRSGLASLSPHDMYAPQHATDNPDRELTFRAVDDAGSTLRGSTRRTAEAERPGPRPRWLYPTAAAAAAVLLAVFALMVLDRSSGSDDMPLIPPTTLPGR
jgi:hypothetical protein